MAKRKSLTVILGALLLGVLLYVAVWPFVVGGSNMQAFCQSLAKGTQISQFRDIVQQSRYRMTPVDKIDRAFIHDPRSFGRFICEVQFKEGRLTSAQYQQND